MGFGKILVAFVRGFAGGARSPQSTPQMRPQGFFWGGSTVTACAAARSFNQKIVGESFYRDHIERITGGPADDGVNQLWPATLIEGRWEGKPTIEVWIGGGRCGNIPKADSGKLITELRALRAEGRPITAKASITAGFEGGDYSLKLSIARPLRERKEN